MDPLRLRFLVPGLGLLALEASAIAVPLLAFFYERVDAVVALVQAALPLALCGHVAWAIAVERRLGPLYEARARRRADPAAPGLDAAATARLRDLPDNAARLRAVMWVLVGVAAALAVRAFAHIPWAEALTVASVVFANTLAPTIFRAWWYEWILERPLGDVAPPGDTGQSVSPLLIRRLRRASAATAAIGISAIALFIYFFIPVTLEQYWGLQTYFPLTIVAILLAWPPLLRIAVRPIRAYLEAPGAAGDVAARAYRTAETLPYTLAAMKLGFSLAGAALLGIEAVWLFGFDGERATLCALTVVFVMVGIAIHESVLHRGTLRPLLAEIARRRPDLVRATRPLLGLLGKMRYAFGGLALFVCSFSLYWGFVQYRHLAMGFIEKQAAREVAHMVEGLRPLAARGRLDGTHVKEYLRAQLGENFDGAIYLLLRDGRTIAVATGGAPPPLPAPMTESIQRRRKGWIDASAIRMQGAFAPIEAGRELGTLVVLLPGYRGRGPGLEENLRVLLVFFVLLLVTASGIVGLVARDLAEPVRTLERRAGAMARGDLASSVPVGPESDEMGRLALAFEEMRAALSDLRSGLERKVEERTRDLRAAQTRLVASGKMAIVGQLVAGVAHEINNPVNAIVNTVEPLEDAIRRLAAGRAGDGADAQEAAEMLRVIRSGADRSKRIVQALRNYARGDGEELQEYDLHRVLDEALELLRHELKHGVAVEKAYGALPRLRGYPGQLSQVFLNLVTNAAQALGGREDGRIRIETRTVAGVVEIAVRDNGPGIPDEVLPRIFEPFFTTKRVGEGTGLGLSICHQIVERHGGTIRVETKAGEGTAMTVVLPPA